MSLRFFSYFLKRPSFFMSHPSSLYSSPTKPILINSRANLSTRSFKLNNGSILVVPTDKILMLPTENEEMLVGLTRFHDLDKYPRDPRDKSDVEDDDVDYSDKSDDDDDDDSEEEFYIMSGDEDAANEMEEHNIRHQVMKAQMFQSEIFYGPDIDAKIYTIMPKNNVNSLEKLSYGYSWIGVNVNDTIFVVAYRDPIRKPPANKTQVPPDVVLQVAIVDMLEMRDPQRSHNGHAVVSVVSCTPGQECAPGYEFQDAKGAIDFLEKKLNADCSSLSPQEIQHIAISALQYLIGSAFKPDRVNACGWGNLNGCDMFGAGISCRMLEDVVLQATSQHPLN